MLAILIVPALSGFLLLNVAHICRYWLYRQTGYHVFFATAFAGALLLILARVIVVALLAATCLPTWWTTFAPFEMSETVAMSLLVALLISILVNCLVGKERAAKIVARSSGNLVSCLLEDVLDDNGLVELTTNNRKSYIGFPRESGVSASGGDVAIVPVVSGYRNEDTLEMTITTQHFAALDALSNDSGPLSDDDFQVVLPQREIVSARRFDPRAYDLIQEESEEAGPL